MLVPAMIGQLQSRGDAARFLELLSHRVQPSELLPPDVLLAAARQLLRDQPARRQEVLKEAVGLALTDLRRRRRRRRPVYGPSQPLQLPAEDAPVGSPSTS
jgi:hypothetical protein